MLPDSRVLPYGAIAAAWDIAQDAIEQQLVLSFIDNPCFCSRCERDMLRWDFDSWEYGRIVVRDHDCGRRKSS